MMMMNGDGEELMDGGGGELGWAIKQMLATGIAPAKGDLDVAVQVRSG